MRENYGDRDNVLLWGLGKNFANQIYLIEERVSSNEINILAVTDKTEKETGREYRFLHIHEIGALRKKIDYVIVISGTYYQEIRNEAISMGIEKKYEDNSILSPTIS